jgi:tRNA uridine 5-carbamoylmethylation protein Kti12
MTNTVLMLMGLPGSGKSTYCTRLHEALTGIVHIEYDVVAESVMDNDERLLAWRLARCTALDQLRLQLLSCHQIILLDDNFHLRSMRKQIYHLCQEYPNIRLGILWMETPLNVCLERNRRRSPQRRVPDHIIDKMHTTLEPPRLSWEICVRVHEDTTIDSIQQFLSNLSIVQPPPDPALLEAQRRITRDNKSHQMDQFMRIWVGIVAQIHRSSVSKANQTRKDLLALVGSYDTDTEGYHNQLLTHFMTKVTHGWAKNDIESLHQQLQGTLR